MTDDAAEAERTAEPETESEADTAESTTGTAETAGETDTQTTGEDSATDTDAVSETAERGDDQHDAGETVEMTAESPEDLVERIATHDEALAADVDVLLTRLDDTEQTLRDREERVEELTSRLRRVQADFQNYKKRAKKRQNQIKSRATEDLVQRLVVVRDNLLRALAQDENVDIRDGVETTLDEFDRILEEENVSPIEPKPGDEVDPQRHEVLMRVESAQEEGTIVEVYQPGYEMAEKVIRAAQVTVSK
ncbi:MAG: nucleotide exchange factor GrpE [Halobacteriota archaeon]